MKNYFGMFIHWGIYSQLEDHEQVLARRNMDHAEYEKLAQTFNPVRYDPDEWVTLAKRAGMKYICFTTKHHDGFCMWDTKTTDYNIMNTPYGRDTLKLLADACARQGMRLSLYYSIPDWHEPCAYNPASSHQWKSVDYGKSDTVAYRAFLKRQLGELLTNYGPVYTLFWDIPPQIDDPSINEYVRSLQPEILINDRGYDAGDFSTPERKVPEGGRFTRMTEACQSVGMQSWGYRRDEDYFTPRFLMQSVDRTMAMGGSYLLNVGPMPDGRIPPEACAILTRIGEWYNKLEGTLEDTDAAARDYGVRSNAMMKGDSCIAVEKNGRTYLHFPGGVSASAVYLQNYPSVPRAVRLMNTGMALSAALTAEEWDASGNKRPTLLRIAGIPADREPLLSEPAVMEIEW
ncbi:MAG: glycoside hydrolase [Ruminococcaceae bacterium]|nr:glycoside hydrolase [Oscillospiraceae bacterium]